MSDAASDPMTDATRDAMIDATSDSVRDAPHEPMTDAMRDAMIDTTSDAMIDATSDAMIDATSDAMTDSTSDSMRDAPRDATSDAMTDSTSDSMRDAPRDAMRNATGDSTGDSTSDSTGDSMTDSMTDSTSDASATPASSPDPSPLADPSTGGGRVVAVVGAGQRVVNDVLPVIASLAGRLRLEGVYTRTPRRIESGGRAYEARSIDALCERGLDGIDIVYAVVAKGAVPAVVERIAARGAGDTELLLETPGLVYKLLGRRAVLEPWRAVWITEDTTTLPLWDAVEAWASATGSIDEVLLDRSGYAYHGVAMARRLLGGAPVLRARRTRVGDGDRRDLELVGGGRASIVGPRSYPDGSVLVRAGGRTIGDRPDADARLEALVEGERCVGFRADGVDAPLTDEESQVIGPWHPAPTLIANMHGLKRVGLRRLLARHADGQPGYSLADGLEDMAVDWHLERFGRYLRNPLTAAHSPWPGRLLRLFGR